MIKVFKNNAAPLLKPTYSSLSCLLFLILTTHFFAQDDGVVVNQFVPLVILDASSDPYSFDFNDDGIIEFVFLVQDLTGDTMIGGLPATYAGAGSVMDAVNGRPAGSVSEGSNVFDLMNLNLGEQVSTSLDFGTDDSFSLAIDLVINSSVIGLIPYQYGTFLGSSGYLGAEFLIGTETHYGWIEIGVSADASLITLYSYGYESNPNTSPIIINHLGVNEMGGEGISIVNYGNTLTVDLSNELVGGELRIFSLSGAELHNVKLEDIENVVDLNHFDIGVYIVTASSKQGLTSQKIFVH
tara:strand:+ start:8050 stop:8940 length:891 start_codon:yes stop_codon:yes gene_type:complete